MSEQTTAPEGFVSQASALGADGGTEKFAQEVFRRMQASHAPPAAEEEKPAEPNGDDEPIVAEAAEGTGEEASAEEAVEAGGEEVEAEAVETEEGEVTEEEDPLIPVKVDGKEMEVPYSEVVAGYQRLEDYKKKTQTLADERRQFEAEKSGVSAEVQVEVQRLSQLNEALQMQLQSLAPDPRAMEELKQSDPGEWAARQLAEQRRFALLQQARQVQAQKEAQAIQAQVPRERAALAAAVPEFAENFDQAYQDLGVWMISPSGGGLSADEWQQVTDHRLVRLAHMARQGQEAQARHQADKDRGRQVHKKVVKLPRVRSSATPPPKDSARDDYDRAIAAYKESGGNDNQALQQIFALRERLKEK